MSIKWKLLLMVGLPVSAIIIILVIGLYSFNSIGSNVDGMNELHTDRATLINADRDAYQAQVAVMDAVLARSMETLKQYEAAAAENLDQTLKRMADPGKRFTPGMMPAYDRFKSTYETWQEDLLSILELSDETLNANLRRDVEEKAALASFGSMRDIIDKLGEMADERLADPTLTPAERRDGEKAVSLILNADRDAYQAYVAQLLIVRSEDTKEVPGLAESFKENLGQTRDRVRQGIELLGAEGAAFSDAFNTQLEKWEQHSATVVELAASNIGKNLRKTELFLQSEHDFETMRKSIDELGNMELSRVKEGEDRLESTIGSTIWLYSGISALFTLLAVIVAWLFSTRLAGVISQAAEVVGALAKGDFTVKLNVNRNDELGTMSDAISDMIAKLRAIVTDVQDATGNVATGSQELAESSESLSQGATEQASSVEEVSSAMEEISASISQNSESSQKTGELARQSVSEAKKGGEAVEQTVTAMTQIAEKISIIEEIARQTNLLALNAAIEAARAGEQGKGFAVVAAEVRKLAERSGTAAAEIGELSTSSVAVATRAGELLNSIVPSIENTAEMVQEISAASAEQDTGASEVNSALQQLDTVVQANAGLSEEIASTAEELSAQAEQLEAAMAFFRIGQSGGGSGSSASRKPVAMLPAAAPEAGDDDDGEDAFERF